LAIWYDLFSLFYDRALEQLYAPFRARAVDALRVRPGARVLDLPCGTGKSLDLLAPAVGPEGAVLGVDLSGGMLGKARKRVARAQWQQVQLRKAPVAEVDAAFVRDALGEAELDGVLCALGLTAFPEWERALDGMLSLLRPGGRLVVLDVYAERPTRESRSVELVARADLARRVWEPLAQRCDEFERAVLPADTKKMGGELYVAAGTRR
jgi:ubiquinone/menaquinone biosynthesis C-methylase UbiE